MRTPASAPACPSRAKRREELNQPLFAAIDAFEFPELHDESIAARNFYRHLSKLMAACGVKDFGMKVCGCAGTGGVCPATQDVCASCLLCVWRQQPAGPSARKRSVPTPLPVARNRLQDIYKPETQRLRRHLSAVINFAKFREEKLVAYRCVCVRTSAPSAAGAACAAASAAAALHHLVGLSSAPPRPSAMSACAPVLRALLRAAR